MTSPIRPFLIVVTFRDDFPTDLVDLLCNSKFVGLSTTERGDNPRVLYLRPTLDKYKVLKAQLEELEREGALSFIEHR